MSNDPLAQRLARQTPRSWPGETVEDVAIFDDAALETLSGELAGEVLAIREALELACDSRGEEALERIAAIPRRSALSEWRLYIRGLISWLEDDHEQAGEAWRRLDSERRPGRMAAAMMYALRGDVGKLSPGKAPQGSKTPQGSNHASAFQGPGQLDDVLLDHARLLRRARFDRAAVKIAEEHVRAPDESKRLLIGRKKVRSLKQFCTDFREAEPALTSALEHVALGRAFAQNDSGVFVAAASAFEGPRHDRRNLLLSYFYFQRFARDVSAQNKSEEYLKEYLENYLPKNEGLSKPLRKAIASQVHLEEAKLLIEPPMRGMMSLMFGDEEDSRAIRKHLKAATKAYPANRSAYATCVDWIEGKLTDDLKKTQRKSLEDELARVMTAWSEGLPDDVKPRLWLVDHLLENEQTEEARPHVDWLAASRQDDPRVRATPWKWALLEAMRLCRRKTRCAQASDRLEEAERLWPAWLSRQWLPHLKAALALRAGNTEEYERQREQACQDPDVNRDSLADACMMLGAAQHMRVPAKDLKPLRLPVDEAVRRLRKLSEDELFSVSGFFWDLQRVNLVYPAYRMHGKKIVGEMFARLKKNPPLVLANYDDDRIHNAALLFSEHRFLGDRYALNLPDWFAYPNVEQHPMFAAATANAVLQFRSPWRLPSYRHLVPQLREAAQSVRDSYYRYWFARLADELDELIASSGPPGFGFNPFERFGELFGNDFDEDEDDLGFDPDCNCPACQAARLAYEASM